MMRVLDGGRAGWPMSCCLRIANVFGGVGFWGSAVATPVTGEGGQVTGLHEMTGSKATVYRHWLVGLLLTS